MTENLIFFVLSLLQPGVKLQLSIGSKLTTFAEHLESFFPPQNQH